MPTPTLPTAPARHVYTPAVLWLTGLSGSGKTTLVRSAARVLKGRGYPVATLDGDQLRRGLCRDLGFSMADRRENIRRAAALAREYAALGNVVLGAFISPLASMRALARETVGPARFREVYVSTPLETCRRRDPKGLYRRAAAGEIEGLTGVDSAYEAPVAPDLRIDTAELRLGEATRALVELAAETCATATSGERGGSRPGLRDLVRHPSDR